MGEYNKRKVGAEYEKLAVSYLIDNDYVIIETNFYCNSGEIDIIAQDKNYLVFIEVKYRKNNLLGEATYAVSKAKQKTIIRVANFYIYKKHLKLNLPYRFDVIAIDNEKLTHIVNAFGGF